MGLFSSREDKIKKIDKELQEFDKELLYKKALKGIYDAAQSTPDPDGRYSAIVVLHHDLQEIKQAIENLK